VSKSIEATDGIDIVNAIHESIHRDCRPCLIVPSISEALTWVNERSESYDSCPENKTEDGRYAQDVWGDDGQGGEFRLLLISDKF